MLNGLMGGTIFPKTDGIMGHHINNPKAHQCRKTNGGTAVIRENQKTSPIGDETSMNGHAIHDSGHTMLPYPIMNITSLVIPRTYGNHVFGFCVVGSCKVCRSSHKFWHFRGDHV